MNKFKYKWNFNVPGDLAQAECQEKANNVYSRLAELEREKGSLEEQLRAISFERYYSMVALDILAGWYKELGKNIKKDFPLSEVSISEKKISIGDVIEFVPYSEISWFNGDIAFRESVHAFGRILALNDKSALLDIRFEPRMRDWKMLDYGLGNYVIDFTSTKIYNIISQFESEHDE